MWLRGGKPYLCISTSHFYLYARRVKYADPVAAMLSVIIIAASAWPLVRSCSWIILQSTPGHLDVKR